MSGKTIENLSQQEADRSIGINENEVQEVKPINGVSPSIISHREVTKKRWLYSHDTLWYYHAPKDEGAQVIQNDDFLDTVDPCLQEIIKGLHELGVKTLPSCQGHFYDEEHYKSIWDKLQREKEAIHTDGLVLRDDETGEDFRFHDESYELPWLSFEEFYQAGLEHQNIGFLGLSVESISLAEKLSSIRETEYCIVRSSGETGDGYEIDFLVRAPDDGEQCMEWARLQDDILSVISEADPSLSQTG